MDVLTSGPRTLEGVREAHIPSFHYQENRNMVARAYKPTITKTKASTRWMKGREPIAPKVRQQTALNKAEVKFFDTALSFNFDSTGEVPATGQLTLIPQGAGQSQRNGYLCNIKSLQIRGVVAFTPGAAANAATNAVIHIMMDRQANGAAAAITDALTSTAIYKALPVVPQQYRFKTLKRIVVPCNSQAGVTTAYNGFNVVIDEYIQFKKPIQVRFNGATGAITEITSSNLFLFAGSDGSSDDTIAFDGNARLRFTDA